MQQHGGAKLNRYSFKHGDDAVHSDAHVTFPPFAAAAILEFENATAYWASAYYLEASRQNLATSKENPGRANVRLQGRGDMKITEIFNLESSLRRMRASINLLVTLVLLRKRSHESKIKMARDSRT